MKDRSESTAIPRIVLATVVGVSGFLFVPSGENQNTSVVGNTDTPTPTATPETPKFDREKVKLLAESVYNKVNPGGERTGNPYLTDAEGARWSLYSSENGSNHLEDSFMQVFVSDSNSAEIARYAVRDDGNIDVLTQESPGAETVRTTLTEKELIDFYNRLNTALITGTVPIAPAAGE